MFKFDFADDKQETLDSNPNETEVIWSQSKEIVLPDAVDLTKFNVKNYNNFVCMKNTIVKYLPSDYIIKSINETYPQNAIVDADKNHSDLVTGVYEGGLKIWECTQDLINFICTEEICLGDKKVLDLGCGVGIVGIYALLNGAYVYFQDYNAEIITTATIPNVVLNMEKMENIQHTSKFYSGDWYSFLNIMENKSIKFDYILTSETIYNANNYDKLHSIFVKCLNNNGVIYVAAKTYYFGVGGGLRAFEDFVASKDLLNVAKCWFCSDGISREIIKLTLK